MKFARRYSDTIGKSSLALLALSVVLPALGSNTWTGGSTTGNNWSDPDNWGGAVPDYSAKIFFGGVERLVTTNDNAATALNGGFTFNADAGSFALWGPPVTLKTSIVNNSTNLQTINFDISQAANVTITCAAGPMTFNGAIKNAANGFTAGGSSGQALTLASAANNFDRMVIQNGARVVLGADNAIPKSVTCGGASTVAAVATLDFNGHSTAISQLQTGTAVGGSGLITNSAGGSVVMRLGGNVNIQAGGKTQLIIAVPVDLTGTNRSFIVNETDPASALLITSTISNGSLTKNGNGTLILCGTNTYTGTTTLNAGMLQLNDVACLSAGMALAMSNNAVLNLNFIGTNLLSAFTNNGAALPDGVYNTDNMPGLIIGSGALKVVTPLPPPTVSLDLPAHSAEFPAYASIPMSASVSSTGNDIASVQFFNGTTLLFTASTPPYSNNWAYVSPGSYSLTAQATYGAGLVVTSAVHSVVVKPLETPVASAPVKNGESFAFQFSGPSGQPYTVLTTTNPALPVQSWEVAVTHQYFDTSGVGAYTNAAPTDPQRFYRVKSP